VFAVLSSPASLPPPPSRSRSPFASSGLYAESSHRRVDVDTRPSLVVTKCTENDQAVCINAGLRVLAPYFTFIDFPFCSGRWCESSSVITVHISGGDNGVKRREPEARARADCPHGARFRVRHRRERNRVTGTTRREGRREIIESNRYRKIILLRQVWLDGRRENARENGERARRTSGEANRLSRG